MSDQVDKNKRNFLKKAAVVGGVGAGALLIGDKIGLAAASTYPNPPTVISGNGPSQAAWNVIGGAPFVTVTPNGPTDGGDYGPNTPNTQTNGIQEWLNAIGPNGCGFAVSGIYNCSVPVYFPASLNGLHLVGAAAVENSSDTGVVIQPATGSSIPFLMAFTNPATKQYQFVIENITVAMNGVSPTLPSSTTLNGALSSKNVTSMTFTSATGWLVGQKFLLDTGASNEFCTIAAISGNTVTVANGTNYTHLNGVSIAPISVLVNLENNEHTSKFELHNVTSLSSTSAGVPLWDYVLDWSGMDDSSIFKLAADNASRVLLTANDGIDTFGGILSGGISCAFQLGKFHGTTFGGGPTDMTSDNAAQGLVDFNNNVSVSWLQMDLFGCYFNQPNGSYPIFSNNSYIDDIRVYHSGGHITCPSSATYPIYAASINGNAWHVSWEGFIHVVPSATGTLVFSSGDAVSILRTDIITYTTSGSGTLIFPSGLQLAQRDVKYFSQYINTNCGSTTGSYVSLVSYTLLAGMLGINGVIKIIAHYSVTDSDTSSENKQFALVFGVTNVATITDTVESSHTNYHTMEITIQNLGATNSQLIYFKDILSPTLTEGATPVTATVVAGYYSDNAQTSTSKALTLQGQIPATTAQITLISVEAYIYSSADSLV